MSMMWVGIGSAVVGAGTSIYGANKASQSAKDAAAAGKRDLGGELTTIGNIIPGFNQAGFQNQQQYNGALTNLNMQNFGNAFQGQFNSGAFDAQNPGFSQFMTDAQSNGQMQGWSPQQMAAAYSGKNANDPSLNQYFSGGLGQMSRNAFNQANPELASYNQQLGGTLAQLNGQPAPRMDASGYWASGSENTRVDPAAQSANTQLGQAAQSGNFSAQSYGGQQNPYNGGGYANLANPNRARDVNATAVQGPDGYDQVKPQTGFQSVNAQSSDFGLMNAQNRLGQSGPSELQQQLTNQAKEGLALGGTLSAEDRRNAQQGAREGWAARGLINSNGAVADEVLNRQGISDQRRNERQAFAQNVENTNFGQGQQGFSNALGLSGAAQNYAGLNLQGQMANQNAGLQGNQLGLQGQIANQGARQAYNTLGQQGQIANQNASLQAQQANQGADLTYNNQMFQTGNANLNAQLQNNQLGLGYASLNNSAFQDAQARLQQGSQFNATLGQNNSQFNAGQMNANNQYGAGLNQANNQYNAGQMNAMTQFGANLGQQNNQFNAAQTNAAGQFNSTATNQASMYNGQMQQQAANDAWARSMGYGNYLGSQAINPFTAYSMVQGQAPDYTTALLGYGNDVYNTNSNAAASAGIAAGNRNAALTGAGIGLIGTGIGAYGQYAGQQARSSGSGNGGYNGNSTINPATGMPW